jgi:hypothetical protein
MHFIYNSPFISSLDKFIVQLKFNNHIHKHFIKAMSITLHIVTCYGWVVRLITRRGFGLVTGFIRLRDLQLQQITITLTTIALVTSRFPLTELHCADVSLRGLTDED